MGSSTVVDERTGRKYTLDEPDDHRPGEQVTFLLNLHGGGSMGMWQHEYFPAYLYKVQYRLVIATPSAATKEPMRRWLAEADDEHLRNIVDAVLARYGRRNIRSFWLVGHSQGGMTANRLLLTPFFCERVDGWLSLSGGRIGPAERSPTAGRPGAPPLPRDLTSGGPRPGVTVPPDCDFSFIFAVGEHEIVKLPETSPWAEKYGAGPRVRLEDVVDEQPGLIYDTRGNSSKEWGLEPRPGTAQVYVYPDARDGRLIADVVRLDKGHTEGLEPRITETLVRLIIEAPGGKLQRLATA
jgi:pimeloyl-ACP methyl ester carboxylesterase